MRTLIRLRSLNQELIAMNMKLEDKVQERTQALESVNKELLTMNDHLMALTESRSHLLANIAHELGTQVTLLHSYVQALREGLVKVEDHYYNNMVNDRLNLLSRIVVDLSDLSKLEAGQFQFDYKQVNLHVWIQETVQKLAFDTERLGRRFYELIDLENASRLTCLIDRERMDQVFANLISNAVKNTSKTEGCIHFKIRLNKNEGRVIFQLQDNGYGISEEDIPLIFERFYKSSYPIQGRDHGTGLGLVIVKEFVEQHQGRVWVESKVNEGSSFYISLPVQ